MPSEELVARKRKCWPTADGWAVSMVAIAASHALQPRASRSGAHRHRATPLLRGLLLCVEVHQTTTPYTHHAVGDRHEMCALIVDLAQRKLGTCIASACVPTHKLTATVLSLPRQAESILESIARVQDWRGCASCAARRLERWGDRRARNVDAKKKQRVFINLMAVARAPFAAWPPACPRGGSTPRRRYFAMLLRTALLWRAVRKRSTTVPGIS